MASSPQEVNSPKIFISYAWKNQTVARQLQRDLMRDGVEVFVDYEKITGGDSLPDRISAALDWCNTLILLWSADSAESYYVKQEWTSAFHLQKRIIACVLDDTALPALLRGRLFLNFSPYAAGYTQLCRSLGVEPKITTPAPVPPSTLPPQHVEIPVGDQTPPSTEVRESPQPVTRKPDSDSAKPVKNAKRWQPLVSKIKVGLPSGSVAARRVSAWWPRGKMMNITFVIILVAMAVVVYRWYQPSTLHLRSEGTTLSGDSVKAMLKKFDFYCADNTWSKDWSNPQGEGIDNQLESSQDGKTIFDRKTGLTWQQSGSLKSLNYEAANVYVDSLRQINYGGYSDWRLPTLKKGCR